MRKNVASQKIGAQMVSAADGSAFTGAVTVAVTIDAGTQATGSVGSGACTHEGNGYHTYAPAQAETNGKLLAFTFIGTGAVPATVQVFTSLGTLEPVADRTNNNNVAALFGFTDDVGETCSDRFDDLDAGQAAGPTASEVATEVHAAVSEGMTFEERTAVILAAVSGASPAPAGGVRLYKSVDGSTDRIAATVSSGNRSSVALDTSDL